ncbi:MAG: hypothetical protein K9J74_08845 [Sulfuritalea sp.]|nr:hypothetical protein [Sulfuritalea sp.]
MDRNKTKEKNSGHVLERMASRLRGVLGKGNTKPDPLAEAVHARLASWQAKVSTAANAVERIPKGSQVFVGTACATPCALVEALEAMRLPPADIELLHFITNRAVPHDDEGNPTTKFPHRSFFVGSDIQAAVHKGLAEYVPLSVARLPELITNGRVNVDVALIQASLPDEFGYVSLGISVDVIPAAVAKARLVIAEINPNMPRSMGDSLLHVDRIDWLVPVTTPIAEYTHPETEDQVVEQIARYISSIIDDGSTLQIGLGRVPNAALKYLADRRDLGIHSDVITDGIIPLLENGILTGRCKTNQRDKVVTSFAVGSRRLYELIDRNPLFSFQPIEAVCHPTTIAAQHKMVSVTQAFAIDLTGQVCVDQLNGKFYGGIAAQGEFLRGASRSGGGKAIICLASTSDNESKSCVRLTLDADEGVTIARTDVHYVITEYGIAYLFGKSIRERAISLIDVAHPNFRAKLLEQAQDRGYIPAGQTLKNLRAYPVEDEQSITLKDKRTVLLRPAVSSDARHIRDLFHTLTDADVKTRFFRTVRGLSHNDIQRLCNVNFENEVAFVAVAGTRENPQIVAQSCYFIDPSTNLAETAFMVSPDWQGCGLGAVMQQRMVIHAKRRGVLGFVAEIMAINAKMIRLANTGSANVHTDSNGTTVKITALF